MKQTRYLTPDDLIFSAVYGGGIYRWSGERAPDPLMGEEALSPLLTNLLTGETFFLRRLDCPGEEAMASCCRRILTPPGRKDILWPSDLVFLPMSCRDDCAVLALRQYTDTPLPAEDRPGEMALLFPRGGYPPLAGGERKLRELREGPGLSWRQPAVRETAAAILRPLAALNRDGYAYEEIHPSRFLFREDGSVFLDYTPLLSTAPPRGKPGAELLNVRGGGDLCAPPEGSCPLEFAEPAFVQGLRTRLDFRSQNYSVTALLFYLFFGRHPYDGRLLSGYVDDNPRKHYIKFRDYHKMPIFLFDPRDESNRLGAFAEEQAVLELWEDCPEPLRTLFQNALCEASALRRGGSGEPPAPEDWLAVLEDLHWIKTAEAGTEDKA